MTDNLTAQARTTIKAPVSAVWQALTDPAIIKQYFFGTNVVTDWKVGSPIYYRGEWQGKPYEDKGVILEFEPPRKLVSTHWSPLAGVPDQPEHHRKITYLLTEHEGATEITLLQDNNTSEEEQHHSEQNWSMMLLALKALLES